MPSAFLDLLSAARSRLRQPVLIVLGAPRLVAELVAASGLPDTTCFQFDLYQAERLREELRDVGAVADVVSAADLWDVPQRFGTVLVPSPPRGERELKRDVVEQAYHVLNDDGRLIILSPVPRDQLYPDLLKKTFGKVGLEARPAGTLLWSRRQGDKPRRRHEITFHVRDQNQSLSFVSRPGVFSYGRLDEGTRALIESMRVEPDDRILELGCGIGAAGVLAARRGGAHTAVTFVDSHMRAVALAEQNARANGVIQFTAVAAARLEGIPEAAFDLALANPPYYAQFGIARLFVEGARRLLAPGGRLFLVTKQADVVSELMAAALGEPIVELRRGYAVLSATRS